VPQVHHRVEAQLDLPFEELDGPGAPLLAGEKIMNDSGT